MYVKEIRFLLSVLLILVLFIPLLHIGSRFEAEYYAWKKMAAQW
jgi:hypothetical protein